MESPTAQVNGTVEEMFDAPAEFIVTIAELVVLPAPI